MEPQRKKCRLILTDFGPVVVLQDYVSVDEASHILQAAADWMTKNVNWQEPGAVSQVMAVFERDWEVVDWRG